MSKVLTALFASPDAASPAIEALHESNVLDGNISVLTSSGVGAESFDTVVDLDAPTGTTGEAVKLGALGALVGGLTSVGAVLSGGATLIAAGPIVSALAGAGAGAGIGAGLGAIVGMGVPENEMEHFEGAIGKGAVLVVVNSDSDARREIARSILERADSERVSIS